MTYSKLVLIFSISALMMNSAFATPSVHWGVFELATPPHCGGVYWCGSAVAPSAMRSAHFTSAPQTTDPFTVWGANEDTAVLVRCTPTSDRNVSVTVFASSEQSSHAEQWRNAIRDMMTRIRCL